MKKVILAQENDNVGTGTEDINQGEIVKVVSIKNDNALFKLKAKEPIPLGHKISLKNINKQEKIIKFGDIIGEATKDIPIGKHVHFQNLMGLKKSDTEE